MVAQSPEPGAHVLNARAFRIELELFSTQKYIRNVVHKIQVILILYITTSHVQRLELTC